MLSKWVVRIECGWNWSRILSNGGLCYWWCWNFGLLPML